MANRISTSKTKPERISVVVISRNEGNELCRTVENYDHTLPAGAEILVIDDGSVDGSVDQVRGRRGRIGIHRVENFGVARARNLGAAKSRGDVIMYSDAHLRLQPDWWRPMGGWASRRRSRRTERSGTR